MLHVHPVPVALHVAVPAAHAPFAPILAAQVPLAPGLHGQVSLVRPLQLESSPVTAQLSEAAGLILQVPHAPAEHMVRPSAHVPFAPSASPHVFVIPLTQMQSSLARPLQFPSFPGSHVSAALGPTAPAQLPQKATPPSPTTHACMPFLQGALQGLPSRQVASSGIAGANEY
jgi:hypothetical protein